MSKPKRVALSNMRQKRCGGISGDPTPHRNRRTNKMAILVRISVLKMHCGMKTVPSRPWRSAVSKSLFHTQVQAWQGQV